jgi:hypothetical protein
MDNQNPGRVNLEISGHGIQRLPTAIHQSRWLQQPKVLIGDTDPTHLAEHLRIGTKHTTKTSRQLVHKPKPGIMPGFVVAGTGITQTGYQLNTR